MPDIILHHYPRSPYAEKVRLALGLKRIAYHSVHHARVELREQRLLLAGGQGGHRGGAIVPLRKQPGYRQQGDDARGRIPIR